MLLFLGLFITDIHALYLMHLFLCTTVQNPFRTIFKGIKKGAEAPFMSLKPD